MEELKRFRWRKRTGTGSHSVVLSEGSLVNNKLVKGRTLLVPGNVVYCTKRELGPLAFEPVLQFDCLQEEELKVEEEKIQQEEELPDSKLKIVKTRRTGYFNVINPLNPGKPINIRPMKFEDIVRYYREVTEEEPIFEDADDIGEEAADDKETIPAAE